MFEYSIHEPLLQVKNVTVSFGSARVLNGVNFTVRDVHRPGHSQGQIVALLGPSGCGKTTLFRLIAGLDGVHSGEILVGLKAKPAQAGLVGVVMQHYPLFNHRTVIDNLKVAAHQAGLGRAEADKAIEEVLGVFGLKDKADAWPAELSGGQRQRIAIAQQMLCNEHLLLMDEPFSGLDPVMKDKACGLIQKVASLHEENTIVIVTHDIESAVKICDQLIVLGRTANGSSVVADIDLKARGIAWREDNESLPAYRETVREVKALFPRG